MISRGAEVFDAGQHDPPLGRWFGAGGLLNEAADGLPTGSAARAHSTCPSLATISSGSCFFRGIPASSGRLEGQTSGDRLPRAGRHPRRAEPGGDPDRGDAAARDAGLADLPAARHPLRPGRSAVRGLSQGRLLARGGPPTKGRAARAASPSRERALPTAPEALHFCVCGQGFAQPVTIPLHLRMGCAMDEGTRPRRGVIRDPAERQSSDKPQHGEGPPFAPHSRKAPSGFSRGRPSRPI